MHTFARRQEHGSPPPCTCRHQSPSPKETIIDIAPSPKRHRRGMAVLLAIVLLAVALACALAWHSAIDVVPVPGRTSFDPSLRVRGAQLAAVGNCAGCHTAPGGVPFAGGTELPTPFGTVYGPNITPHPQDGIGGWSEAAFRRALREGVSRDGHLLYPAFPYDHFTHLVDTDISALYAFVMGRDPVAGRAPANRMDFPLGFRPLIAGWNLLYLDKGPVAAAGTQTAEWKRGEYLVDALAHCTACHSPRNRLGAEQHDHAFSGGEAEGWHATALDVHSPSPVPWSVEALAAYLKTGMAADHALAAGPMQKVVHELGPVPAQDVHAMAVYVQSLMGTPTAERAAREKRSRQQADAPTLASADPPAADSAVLALGQRVYADSCAGCHDLGRRESSGSGLRLPLAVALYLPDPRNLVHIVREGIQPAPGGTGRWMPAFNGSLTEPQITALVTWLRQQATDAPPWNDVAQVVAETRSPTP